MTTTPTPATGAERLAKKIEDVVCANPVCDAKLIADGVMEFFAAEGMTLGEWVGMGDMSIVVLADPPRVEIVVRDAPTAWVTHSASVEIGYDMSTRELIAVRVWGNVTMTLPARSG
jgi:hypothetical protein